MMRLVSRSHNERYVNLRRTKRHAKPTRNARPASYLRRRWHSPEAARLRWHAEEGGEQMWHGPKGRGGRGVVARKFLYFF